ncbi:membrane protein insertase YidC [Flavobacteriaceae bacterium]|jgi:YidC/Oxa1 family membrane protein insertase|nr:membrane protein insertase YidC [Cryomorphaceae bacterium]MBT3684986.1 membrane protein insertase YidC [Cryomorphaceae bacterium]MDC0879366.1 membrane protein insertase YidC [Flavobacteriaceae bacterium]MDC6461928.1 membrane protein insertase YidC [Flavobacteriaceae bacterium]
MEENKFDPLQFIGFLLISAILMFWFYDNQSSYVENQQDIVVENPIEKFEDNSNTLNLAKEDSNKVELDKKFKEEIITLENDKILFEISTSGADINKLLLKDFSNYNDQPLFLVNDNKSIFSYNIPIGRNSIINSRDLNYSAEIIKDKSILKLTAVIDSQRSLELTYSLEENSSILDFDLRLNDSDRNSTYDQLELVWGKDSFRNSKSIDYENRYTALSYGFEDEKDSWLSVAGTSNKNINNVNWISFREHFFSSILILNNETNNVEISSEDLASNETLDNEFTKRFKANIPLSLDSDNDLSFKMYFGPTDYETLKEYNLSLENSVDMGWGIFGWLNRFIFFPLFSFLTTYFSYGISIILMTIIVKVSISPLTYKSYLSQIKMKILKPELEVINEKFKDDAMKKQQETMKLYTKSGANPMSGCLPAFLQMPIFFALFVFFPAAFSLRQKSFLWADDLSSYDSILDLGFYIPLYGDHISLFPILASISIFFYTKMTTGQQMMPASQTGGVNMKVIMYLMPLMMLFFFNNYASGLSLYYFISNLLTIILMLIIKNFIIDDNKILSQIEENKKKPVKVGGFRARLQKALEEAEKQKKSRGK